MRGRWRTLYLEARSRWQYGNLFDSRRTGDSMRSRRFTLLVVTTTATLVVACAAPSDRPVEAEPNRPPTRTGWALQHRLLESEDLHVTGSSVGHTTSQRVSASAGATAGPSRVPYRCPCLVRAVRTAWSGRNCPRRCRAVRAFETAPARSLNTCCGSHARSSSSAIRDCSSALMTLRKCQRSRGSPAR